MEITEVRSYRLRYPLSEPFANARGWSTSRTGHLVEIVTDAGITGWGEGATSPASSAVRDCLTGRDPFETEVIWSALHDGREANIGPASGIDIALWDIAGKALDVPVHRLLGGAFRDRVPAYASGLFRKKGSSGTEALEEEAARYVDQGFGAVKMKVGFGPSDDGACVAAVRRAIGDSVALAVDANCGYDVPSAIDAGRRMAEHDLLWFEEPVSAHDVRGYHDIRRALGIRLAGGETLRGRWAFRELVQQRALDVVQPDISYAGGFTECRKIAAMAQANHVRVLPHMWGTAVRLAATLQWQATLPDMPEALSPFPCLLEYDMTENGLRTDLALEPIRPVDGHLAVPQSPGLGFDVDREVLEKYAV